MRSSLRLTKVVSKPSRDSCSFCCSALRPRRTFCRLAIALRKSSASASAPSALVRKRTSRASSTTTTSSPSNKPSTSATATLGMSCGPPLWLSIRSCSDWQVDEPLGRTHACSALRAGAREAGAVGFDEREFVAAGDVGRDRFVEPLRQRDRGADEAVGPPRGQSRHAQVDHLDTQAVGVRHEITARKLRRGEALRRVAGDLQVEVEVGTTKVREQRHLQG